MIKQKIVELIGDNKTVARALHLMGISVSEHTENTLEDVAKAHNLDLDKVKHHIMTLLNRPVNALPPLNEYPIDYIIAYLKHSHHVFIKQRLPYLNFLVKDTPEEAFPNKHIGSDLKFIFPIFHNDYIRHIYEEEDKLFFYVNALLETEAKTRQPNEMADLMQKHSIYRYSSEHEGHDDEMAGIRLLTENYKTTADTDIRVKVLYAELAEFEKELKEHADIEDRILFPRALALENEVRFKLSEIGLLN